MTVAVHGAQAGEHVVLNQNFDPGWTADGSRAQNWADQVSAPLHGPDTTIVFRYRPVLWWPGLLVFAATVGGVGWAFWRVRRLRRARVARRG
jgi:hypothetical protein